MANKNVPHFPFSKGFYLQELSENSSPNLLVGGFEWLFNYLLSTVCLMLSFARLSTVVDLKIC